LARDRDLDGRRPAGTGCTGYPTLDTHDLDQCDLSVAGPLICSTPQDGPDSYCVSHGATVAAYAEHSPELRDTAAEGRIRTALSRPSGIWRQWRVVLRRLAWSCPLLAVIFATGLLALFDASLHDAFLAALVLVWLGLVLLGTFLGRRSR
jgi:hypothetical protein